MTLAEARRIALAAHEQIEAGLREDRADEARKSGTIEVTLEYAGRAKPIPIEIEGDLEMPEVR